jgi:hypothetical protein
MIPETTLQLARDIVALQARAIAECETLLEMAAQATGTDAVSTTALARECEQVGKVLTNYMPRILQYLEEPIEAA